MTAAVEAPPQAERAPGELSHRQILTILVGLMLGMFLAALDQNIVATAIRTIADDLGGLDKQAWATTAFLITSTIATPLYGKLSDIYGRKPFFLFAISIFLIGSVTCTFAQSMYQLAAFRALQGIGAGGLFSLALTILGDIVPPRERARYQGMFLAVFGTSSVLGPVIGGLLSGANEILGIAGWRWIFLINVPIGAVALVVVAKFLNVPHTKRANHRIDWPGAAMLAVGLVPLLIVAEQGRTWGWGSANSITCYAIGVVGLIAFLFAERFYGDDALLPLRLFRNRVFALVTIVGVIVGMGMFGGIVLLPQFLQIVRGATPIQSGFLMLPLVAGIMVASITSGQLTSRTGRYKVFPVLGTFLMTAAMVVMYFRVNVDIPLWELDVYMAVFGLGLGGCMQTLVLAVQNASPARDMGVVTGSSTFFRQLGGTLGVAFFLSIVFSTVPDKIKSAFVDAAANDPNFQAAIRDPAVLANPVNAPVVAALQNSGGATGDAGGVLNDSSFLQQIDPRLARPFLVGFSDSIQTTFIIVAAILAVAFLLVLFVKELPLRTMSGAQAAAMEAAEAAGAAQVGPETADDDEFAARDARDAADDAPTAVLNGSGPVPPDSPTRPVPLLAPARTGGPEIFGTVSRGDGAGLASVVVTVADPTGRQEARAVTGPDGGYRLPLRAGGTYLVVAASQTFQPHAGMVPVADAPVRHDIAMAGSAGVHGVVRTVDGGGAAQGVSGAAVTLIDARGDVAAAGVADGAGAFRLAGVPDGSYTLTAASRGYQPVAASVTLGVGQVVEHDLQLPSRSRLAGTVTAASDGRPVHEAVATLVDQGGTVVGSAVTGPDGTFAFDDLPEGTYTLTATGFAPVAQVVHVTAGVPAAATVALGRAVTSAALVGATNGRGSNGAGSNGSGSNGVGPHGAGANGTGAGVDLGKRS